MTACPEKLEMSERVVWKLSWETVSYFLKFGASSLVFNRLLWVLFHSCKGYFALFEHFFSDIYNVLVTQSTVYACSR